MASPTNQFTVTLADAHSHSIAQSGIAADDQAEAASNFLQHAVNREDLYASLVPTDTWTISVTQP
jgi:hypothetical protein